jgi:hypothetical protein
MQKHTTEKKKQFLSNTDPSIHTMKDMINTFKKNGLDLFNPSRCSTTVPATNKPLSDAKK